MKFYCHYSVKQWLTGFLEMKSATLSAGNNCWIVTPDCVIISATFSEPPLISTKAMRTSLRNLGTRSDSRCLTHSRRNFIGSDFSDANTGAKIKIECYYKQLWPIKCYKSSNFCQFFVRNGKHCFVFIIIKWEDVFIMKTYNI